MHGAVALARLASEELMETLVFGVAISLMFLGSAPFSAHHSISAHYHRGERVTMEGVIAVVHYRNPHASIELDVTAGSTTERWELEWDDTEDLEEVGITATTFRQGDRVVVVGNPARDDSPRLYIRNLRRPADGVEYVDD
jgi:hypothetical protein